MEILFYVLAFLTGLFWLVAKLSGPKRIVITLIIRLIGLFMLLWSALALYNLIDPGYVLYEY